LYNTVQQDATYAGGISRSPGSPFRFARLMLYWGCREMGGSPTHGGAEWGFESGEVALGTPFLPFVASSGSSNAKSREKEG
jgi:hypothetical protein